MITINGYGFANNDIGNLALLISRGGMGNNSTVKFIRSVVDVIGPVHVSDVSAIKTKRLLGFMLLDVSGAIVNPAGLVTVVANNSAVAPVLEDSALLYIMFNTLYGYTGLSAAESVLNYRPLNNDVQSIYVYTTGLPTVVTIITIYCD